MAGRKKEPQANNTTFTDEPPAEHGDSFEGHAPEAPAKKPWQQLLGDRRDNVVGIRIEEDRKNNNISILLRDRAPALALKAFATAGFVNEGNEGLIFTKKIDNLRRKESWEKAEHLYVQVDNILRAEQGIEAIKSFYVSRS